MRRMRTISPMRCLAARRVRAGRGRLRAGRDLGVFVWLISLARVNDWSSRRFRVGFAALQAAALQVGEDVASLETCWIAETMGARMRRVLECAQLPYSWS
jgi:hypothetical protein